MCERVSVCAYLCVCLHVCALSVILWGFVQQFKSQDFLFCEEELG